MTEVWQMLKASACQSGTNRGWITSRARAASLLARPEARKSARAIELLAAWDRRLWSEYSCGR